MLKNIVTGAGVALALLLGGCMTPSPYKPAPPDPALQARVQAVSPMAHLSTNNLTYRGELPPYITTLSEAKTDPLGDVPYYETADVVERMGEKRVRRHVVKLARVCARVELQKIALVELRRQTDAAEASQARAYRDQKTAVGIGSGSLIGGGISAWSSFGRDYGITYLLGGVFPGLANNYAFMRSLDQNDVNIALNLAQGRFWYAQNDIWLESMGAYCPTLITWLTNHGEIVEAGQAPIEASQLSADVRQSAAPATPRPGLAPSLKQGQAAASRSQSH